MSELKVGDVVSLKSGGTPMTIHKIGHFSSPAEAGSEEANCVWFMDGKLAEAVFDLRTIEGSEQ